MDEHPMREPVRVISGTSTWNPKPIPGANHRRRRFPRWSVVLPIRELQPQDRVMRATSISAGGLFCPDVPPRDPGDLVTLEVDLLGGVEPVVAEGRIVYTGTGQHGLGIGVAFDQPQPLLARYLASLPTPPQNSGEITR